MIDHSFKFTIHEHFIEINENFKNYIKNFPITEFEFNYNSYFNENSDNKLLQEVNLHLKKLFEKYNQILTKVWIQKYNHYQFHDLHTHSSTNSLSFLWYVDCSENSSNTVFFNPGYPYINTNKLEIKPNIGKIIIFDGCLPHYVTPNKDNVRTIISGNLINNFDLDDSNEII